MEKLSGNIKVTINDDVVRKMKEAYLTCPTAIKYVNSLGIPGEQIDENISKIYDFVRDINYCKRCPGLDNCLKADAHLCTKIVYQDGVVERQLTPCKEFLKRLEFMSQFAVRDFDKAWLEVQIKGLDNTDQRKEVLEKYFNYISDGTSDWIYICGEQNTGRTYLAAVIAGDLARKNKGPIAFLNTSLRTKELSDYSFKNQDEFKKLIDKYSSVPVLVLDDFGNEFKNDFVRDGIIFEILNKRSSNHLFTIFTSDFTIDDIVSLYSVNKAAAIRARQIGKIIRNNAKEEISLGEISIY